MTTPAQRRAQQHDQIAEVMEDTEARMHETADKLRSPKREALHRRARRVTEQAQTHQELAEEIRDQDASQPDPTRRTDPRADGD